MAARRQGLCLCVCLVVCLTTLVTSSDISFNASPPTVHPLETREVTLLCALTDSDTGHSDVSLVHDLSISKAGVELASVSERLGPNVFDNTTGVEVTGQVPETGEGKRYLQISWKFPDFKQGREYRCDIRGMCQHGHVKTFSKSIYVAVNELSVNDIVGYIHNLKLANYKQNETNTALNMKMSDMKINNSALQVQVNDLKTKQDTKVIFTSFVGSNLQVSPGDVVVFNKIQTNIGNGYDNSTGVFTSPVSGYYVIDVHTLGQRNKVVKVCINHNGKCVASVFGNGRFDWQAGSNSVSLYLQRWDTVKVVNSYQQSYLEGEQISSFSGRLIALE